MAIIGAAFPVAILVGPLAGGAITDTGAGAGSSGSTSRSALIALALAAGRRSAHGAGRMPRHFDVAGAAVFTAALVALVLAVTLGC